MEREVDNHPHCGTITWQPRLHNCSAEYQLYERRQPSVGPWDAADRCSTYRDRTLYILSSALLSTVILTSKVLNTSNICYFATKFHYIAKLPLPLFTFVEYLNRAVAFSFFQQ